MNVLINPSSLKLSVIYNIIIVESSFKKKVAFLLKSNLNNKNISSLCISYYFLYI